MPHPADRLCYQPSGRCDGARLPRALAYLAAASIGIAILYLLMLRQDVYMAILSVVFPAALAAAATRLAVKYAHCRNRGLAAALGMVCGLTGYLGYFHLDQSTRWGVPWTALDRVPNYVAFRMATDQWDPALQTAVLRPAAPAPGVQPARPLGQADLRSWSWLAFWFELLVLSGVPLTVSFATAGEPYSERQRQWCNRESLFLKSGAGAALRQALADGTVAAWVDAGPPKVGAHQEHDKISIWYTPAVAEDEPELEAYVTPGHGRPLQLFPAEAGALVQLLPALRDLAGPGLTQLSAEAETTDDPQSARVWPVPPPFAGQAQNPRNRLLGACLRWGLLLVPPLLPLALLIGGTSLLHDLAMRNALPGWVLITYVFGVGLGSLVFVVYWLNPERLMPIVQGRRFDLWLLRRAVANRPSPLVRADDFRALFVEMCPRRLWAGGRVKCGDYNQGLLRLDADDGEILFEGDYECYCIPAEAVLACDVEMLTNMPATTAAHYATVLQVRLGSGVWEFPFFPLAGIAGNNWERAVTLRQSIETLCGRTFGDQPVPPPRAPGPVVV